MFTTHALECPVHFLDEKRTEPYLAYGERVSQAKNVLGAKNSRKAASSAGCVAGEVRES